jgi:hypothetical protein
MWIRSLCPPTAPAIFPTLPLSVTYAILYFRQSLTRFAQLGLNTVRVYSVNPYADHSACMRALDAAQVFFLFAKSCLSILTARLQWHLCHR